MKMNSTEVKARITDYIKGEYRIGNDQVLDDSINLYEEGIVDSLGAFTIAAFLEDTFDVHFEEEHFFDPRFRTINGMTALICEVKQGL